MIDFSSLAVPVIQAPMAGGISTPRLVSAVSNSGGIGSFGFAYDSAQKIGESLAAVRAMTRGPVNANFFIFPTVSPPKDGAVAQAMQALDSLGLPQGLALVAPQPPYAPDLSQQLLPIWEHRPAVLTFHFGIPSAGVMDRAHALQMRVGVTATQLSEAQMIERSGADFIVAQGLEAGGHRGTFEPDTNDAVLDTLTLTRLLSSRCSIPIVSAGGLMSGGDIRKALDAGAVAAQMGTAFLCCEESGASTAHKEYILGQRDRPTVLTRAFSGRLARGIENAFIRGLSGEPVLPFPVQNSLTAPLRQWAARENNGEFQSLWAGTAFGRARQMSVSDLMRILGEELAQTGRR